jgi:diketogulonate reductase-like aldo/keto reductase
MILPHFFQLWCTDHHPDHVEAACRKSLAELQIDYFDLYLIHWPVAFQVNKKFKFKSGQFNQYLALLGDKENAKWPPRLIQLSNHEFNVVDFKS